MSNLIRSRGCIDRTLNIVSSYTMATWPTTLDRYGREEMHDETVLDKMIKRIHVNMHHIRYNKKHGTNKPVLTVKTSKSNNYGHEVNICGPSKVVNRPDKPLSCGARVWIETESEVNIS